MWNFREKSFLAPIYNSKCRNLRYSSSFKEYIFQIFYIVNERLHCTKSFSIYYLSTLWGEPKVQQENQFILVYKINIQL